MIDEEGEEALTSDVEDGFYNRRLDGGLFTLQTVDYILAWLMMEDDGVSSLRILFPAQVHCFHPPTHTDSKPCIADIESQRSIFEKCLANFADVSRSHRRR